VTRISIHSWCSLTFLLFVACGFAGCAASLGPGYIVVKQDIHVSFQSHPEPQIHISAEYHLKNTGNQDLDTLDVRLPGRRFHSSGVEISWDGSGLAPATAPDNARETILSLPRHWTVGASHTLHFTYDILSSPAEQNSIGFTSEAFYLPAAAWSPQLPQSRGFFGFGGVPPKKWQLAISVPQDFLVHASGGKEKHSRKGAQTEFQFQQTADDLIPFVVAGRYRENRQDLAHDQKIRMWSRSGSNPIDLQPTGSSLAQILASYQSFFGRTGKSNLPLWIVECPADTGCLPQRESGFSSLLFAENAEASVEMISQDTVVVASHRAKGMPEALATPALAAGWLGYGKNPGFYQEQLPMSALPAFAAALARELSSGSQIRGQIISRAMAQIPPGAARASNNDPNVFRAKSLLLFYALQERVGAETFQHAVQHMLAARSGRDFEVADLIAALEQESHQPVGPFVRDWLKRPGIPEDFRAKYSQQAISQNPSAQEATQ